MDIPGGGSGNLQTSGMLAKGGGISSKGKNIVITLDPGHLPINTERITFGIGSGLMGAQYCFRY